MRRIDPKSKLMQEFIYTQKAMPVDRPVVQYIRQSNPGQVKHNLQSKIQQDEMLSRRLISMGWTVDQIIKIDADQGKSGQKLRMQRKGLDELYQLITSGEAGAVAAYDASRLWRDTTHKWYNDFIDMCKRYNIPVIMFHRVYWLSNRQDEDGLREEFAQAAYYLRHVEEKVNPARLQAIEYGNSYGGHAIPVGYIIGKTDGRKHYVIYEPHAKLVRWLFRRFRALDGNLSRLGRECLATGFSFPNFEGVEKIPHIALKLDGNKYPVHTRGALHSILTNPAYIGWYVFSRTEEVKNEHGAQIIENGKVKKQKIATVVSKTAHEAIVPMDDFMFAYNRLSLTTLEGEINEDRPAINRRYGVGCEALLEGIVESDGKPVYVMAHNQTYTARTFNDGWKTTELVVSVKQLDTAFMGAVRFLLAVLEYRHEIGEAADLREKIIALLNEKAEEASTLEHDIDNVEKGIREWEMAKRVAMGEEYEAGVIEATRQLKKLHADKAAIEARTKQVDAESEDLTELQGLLDRVMHAWGGMTFGLKRRFITLTVEKANIREETPHIIRIDVVLKEPIRYRFTGYMFRHRGSKPKWTDEEMAVLKRMYKQADRLEILKAIPTRTWASIMGQSMTMGLERTTRLNTSGIHEALTYTDVELMQQIGMKDTKQAIWKHNPEIEAAIADFDTILNLFESGGIDALLQNGFLDSLPASIEEFCTAMRVRR
ncbi:MAG: recombinase family protein [Ktedonobacteraceae bacterium]